MKKIVIIKAKESLKSGHGPPKACPTPRHNGRLAVVGKINVHFSKSFYGDNSMEEMKGFV
jgi:hypothetical protein